MESVITTICSPLLGMWVTSWVNQSRACAVLDMGASNVLLVLASFDSYETTPKLHGFLMIRRVAWMNWIKQRTAACDEPFGCEHRVEKLRVERLSRVELRRVESLRSVYLINKNR